MTIRITVRETGIAKTLNRLNHVQRNIGDAVSEATGQLAHDLRKTIVTGVRKQSPGGVAFKPLAASTIEAKGSSKALIDKGDLIRSINVTSLGKYAYFVGVHREVMAKDGQPMVNIAEVHEFGTRDGRIPARPYLVPSYNAWQQKAESKFASMLSRRLGIKVRQGILQNVQITGGV